MSELTDRVCSRCECCSTYWVNCEFFGCEDGLVFTVTCFDDLCQGTGRCMHGDGEAHIPCEICEGKSGWWNCIGNCDDVGKHEDPEARPVSFDRAWRDVGNAMHEVVHQVFMEPPIGPVLLKILDRLNRLIKRLTKFERTGK